jgi:hypothetical protein
VDQQHDLATAGLPIGHPASVQFDIPNLAHRGLPFKNSFDELFTTAVPTKPLWGHYQYRPRGRFPKATFGPGRLPGRSLLCSAAEVHTGHSR